MLESLNQQVSFCDSQYKKTNVGDCSFRRTSGSTKFPKTNNSHKTPYWDSYNSKITRLISPLELRGLLPVKDHPAKKLWILLLP